MEFNNTPITCHWVEASANPWGVRVLDIRPVTLRMLSASQNPEVAVNAVSFASDDGTSFIDQQPPEATRNIVATPAAANSLTYKTDGVLADGVLFVPQVMEHKWAIFYHGKEIIFVRSWTRQVHLRASTEQLDGCIKVTRVVGTFGMPDESPELTVKLVDFLLKSHVLLVPFPVPLPLGLADNPKEAALLCMSLFGKMALFATPYEVTVTPSPQKPMRSHSLLHIAVAKCDIQAVETYLDSGMSVNLVAGEGNPLLQWALLSGDPIRMATLLLDRGAAVDGRNVDSNATPLMGATEKGQIDAMTLLVERGADVNAADEKGFTSLHRACEMNKAQAVTLLLERGANVSATAKVGGHTPLSLAQMRGNSAIVKQLQEKK